MAEQSRIYSFMPRRYGDLKAAVAALIHAAGGEQNAADHCRVGKEAGDVFERAEVFLADGEIDHLEAAGAVEGDRRSTGRRGRHAGRGQGAVDRRRLVAGRDRLAGRPPERTYRGLRYTRPDRQISRRQLVESRSLRSLLVRGRRKSLAVIYLLTRLTRHICKTRLG